MSSRSGGCLCGEIRFTGSGDSEGVHVCHCADCQRWSGGPFLGVAFSGGIKVEDDTSLHWYASSAWAERGSCRTCGSSLFYRLRENPDVFLTTAGAMDEATSLPPIYEHIFADRKPHYYDFADDAPRLTAAETLARVQGSGNE